MRYYVTADIHGFFDPFMKALAESGYFADEGEKRLIVCGDMLDRGKQSSELIDFMLELKRKNELIFIRGNHEDLLQRLICDLEDGELWEIAKGTSYHVHNGTWKTALTLGKMTERESLACPKKLAKRIESSDFFRKLIPYSVDYYETENYIFVHGWIPCSPSDGNPTYRSFRSFSFDRNWRKAPPSYWTAARWYNGIEFACRKKLTVNGKTVVCGHYNASYGHTVCEGRGPEFGAGADHSPFIAKGIIALDACTADSGRVNVMVIEDN